MSRFFQTAKLPDNPYQYNFPFKEAALAMQERQKNYDLGVEERQNFENKLLEVSAIPGIDQEALSQRISDYYTAAEDLVGSVDGDYSLINPQLKSLAMDASRDMSMGITGNIANNKALYDNWMEDLDKQYEDGNITQQQYQDAKDYSTIRYQLQGGASSTNELGKYNQFSGYTPPKFVDVNTKMDELINGMKASGTFRVPYQDAEGNTIYQEIQYDPETDKFYTEHGKGISNQEVENLTKYLLYSDDEVNAYIQDRYMMDNKKAYLLGQEPDVPYADYFNDYTSNTVNAMKTKYGHWDETISNISDAGDGPGGTDKVPPRSTYNDMVEGKGMGNRTTSLMLGNKAIKMNVEGNVGFGIGEMKMTQQDKNEITSRTRSSLYNSGIIYNPTTQQYELDISDNEETNVAVSSAYVLPNGLEPTEENIQDYAEDTRAQVEFDYRQEKYAAYTSDEGYSINTYRVGEPEALSKSLQNQHGFYLGEVFSLEGDGGTDSDGNQLPGISEFDVILTTTNQTGYNYFDDRILEVTDEIIGPNGETGMYAITHRYFSKDEIEAMDLKTEGRPTKVIEVPISGTGNNGVKRIEVYGVESAVKLKTDSPQISDAFDDMTGDATKYGTDLGNQLPDINKVEDAFSQTISQLITSPTGTVPGDQFSPVLEDVDVKIVYDEESGRVVPNRFQLQSSNGGPFTFKLDDDVEINQDTQLTSESLSYLIYLMEHTYQ